MLAIPTTGEKLGFGQNADNIENRGFLRNRKNAPPPEFQEEAFSAVYGKMEWRKKRTIWHLNPGSPRIECFFFIRKNGKYSPPEKLLEESFAAFYFKILWLIIAEKREQTFQNISKYERNKTQHNRCP